MGRFRRKPKGHPPEPCPEYPAPISPEFLSFVTLAWFGCPISHGDMFHEAPSEAHAVDSEGVCPSDP